MRRFQRHVTAFALVAAAALIGGCSGTSDLSTALDSLVAGTSTTGDTASLNTATAAATIDAAAVDATGANDGALRGRGHHGPPGPFAELNLTDEQETQAQQIHEAARADIDSLITAGRDQMRAVLTDEQRTKLDELRAAHDANKDAVERPELTDNQKTQIEALHEQLRSGEITFEEFRTQVQEITGVELPIGRGGPQRPALRGPGPFGGPGLLEGPFADRLAEVLGLTDEQRAAIDDIRQSTRDAVEARHDQARDEFRAILTAEQLAILDEWEANHPRPGLE